MDLYSRGRRIAEENAWSKVLYGRESDRDLASR